MGKEATNTTNIFFTDSDYSNNNKAFHYLLGFQPSLGGMILFKDKINIILDSRYFDKLNDKVKANINNILGNKIKINFTHVNNRGEIYQ